MAKLYFKYGTVSSGKTLQLLVTANNYERQNKEVLILKPKIDTRFGQNIIKTRVGITRKVDVLLNDILHTIPIPESIACILVDEVQFLSTEWINYFKTIVAEYNIPVICFGLKTNFKNQLFEGSKRLFEIADSIEEIKTICYRCTKKATVNLKFVNGKPVTYGPAIELGAEEMYLPVCWDCYFSAIHESILSDS